MTGPVHFGRGYHCNSFEKAEKLALAVREGKAGEQEPALALSQDQRSKVPEELLERLAPNEAYVLTGKDLRVFGVVRKLWDKRKEYFGRFNQNELVDRLLKDLAFTTLTSAVNSTLQQSESQALEEVKRSFQTGVQRIINEEQ